MVELISGRLGVDVRRLRDDRTPGFKEQGEDIYIKDLRLKNNICYVLRCLGLGRCP